MPYSDAALTVGARWIANCRSFVEDNFGVTPDPWQADAMARWDHTSAMLLLACKGPGKSAFDAWMALHFVATRRRGQVVVTSITRDNLRDNLWKEISTWYARSPYLKAHFALTTERLFARESPNDWWISARGWSKQADEAEQATVLAGFHGDHVMFVGDEAGDYKPGFIAAVEAIQANLVPGSGREAKILFSANPTNPTGPIYDIASRREAPAGQDVLGRYQVIRITADPDSPMRTPRVPKAWAQSQIDQYGRDNPYVLVNVFGRFPPAAINALLSYDEVMEACGRPLPRGAWDWAQPRLGIDPSLYGDDPTAIYLRQGLVAFPCLYHTRHDRMSNVAVDIANAVQQADLTYKRLMESERAHVSPLRRYVDATGGWGQGVKSLLAARGIDLIDVEFGSTKVSDAKYANRRAEIWMRMAEWIKKGGSLPKDSELVRELCAATYTYTPAGKFMLEPKDEMRAKLGGSPNRADALACTFADIEMPRDYIDPVQVALERDHPRIVNDLTDYDPLKATW